MEIIICYFSRKLKCKQINHMVKIIILNIFSFVHNLRNHHYFVNLAFINLLILILIVQNYLLRKDLQNLHLTMDFFD